jgi:hypothetical protein
MFRHPKYYKELRKLRNKLDQAISEPSATAQVERAPGPGPKRQAKKWKLNKFTMDEDVYVEDKS